VLLISLIQKKRHKKRFAFLSLERTSPSGCIYFTTSDVNYKCVVRKSSPVLHSWCCYTVWSFAMIINFNALMLEIEYRVKPDGPGLKCQNRDLFIILPKRSNEGNRKCRHNCHSYIHILILWHWYKYLNCYRCKQCKFGMEDTKCKTWYQRIQVTETVSGNSRMLSAEVTWFIWIQNTTTASTTNPTISRISVMEKGRTLSIRWKECMSKARKRRWHTFFHRIDCLRPFSNLKHDQFLQIPILCWLHFWLVVSWFLNKYFEEKCIKLSFEEQNRRTL